MKTIKFEMMGICPLMLNNAEIVNPFSSIAKQLKKLTSKRTKTDEDQEEIMHLKFLASVYLNNKGQYILPANMIMACIVSAAKERKNGAKFYRSAFVRNDALLQFPENGCTPEELYQNFAEKYVDIRPVGIKGSKIPASRFIIPEWSVEVEMDYDESMINDEEMWDAIETAGLRYGIGTYRQRYGRFEARLIEKQVIEKKKKGK